MKEILQYLGKEYDVQKLGDTRWSHAVNSPAKLAATLKNPDIHFIESDIRISPDNVAVAVHPPHNVSDLTLENLLEQVQNSRQGLKLDFKDPEILERALKLLARMKLQQPVLVNADILQGNGANPSKFSAAGFLAMCEQIYPAGILSIGWTTTADPNKPYTRENIDEMLELCKGVEQVTFPVRACLLPNSWNELQHLLELEQSSLTVWNNEPVDRKLANWIKDNTDPETTFYDFIDENKDPLLFEQLL